MNHIIEGYLPQALRFYQTFKDGFIYYYANQYAFKCNVDGKVCEYQQCPQIVLPVDDEYNGYRMASVDEAQFYTSQRYCINGQERYISTHFDEIIEFDGFNVRKIFKIPNFCTDRLFNKVAVVNNRIFFTDGTLLLELLPQHDYLYDSTAFIVKEIEEFDSSDSIRLYNIMSQLVIRDARNGNIWVLAAGDNVAEQVAKNERFNLMLYTPDGVIGYNDDLRQTCLMTFVQNKIAFLAYFTYRDFEFTPTSLGFRLTNQATLKLFDESIEETDDRFAQEFSIINTIIAESQKIGHQFLLNNKLYIPELQFFVQLKNQQVISNLRPWMYCYLINYCSIEYLRQHFCFIKNLKPSLVISLLNRDFTVREIKSLAGKCSERMVKRLLKSELNPSRALALAQIYRLPFALIQFELETGAIFYICEEVMKQQCFEVQVETLKKAVHFNSLQTVRFMKKIVHPSQIQAEDSPLTIAIEHHNVEMCAELFDYRLPYGLRLTELAFSVQRGFSEGLQIFSDQIRMQSGEGRTALMEAAASRRYEMLQALTAEHGLQDSQGRTALMFAVERSNWAAVSSLLDEAGRISAGGRFAFEIAAQSGAPQWVLVMLFRAERELIFSRLTAERLEKMHHKIVLALRETLYVTGMPLGDRLKGRQGAFFVGAFDFDYKVLTDQTRERFIEYKEAKEYQFQRQARFQGFNPFNDIDRGFRFRRGNIDDDDL